jgi:hypothetical protein
MLQRMCIVIEEKAGETIVYFFFNFQNVYKCPRREANGFGTSSY